jgi:anti-anti-sigma factor
VTIPDRPNIGLRPAVPNDSPRSASEREVKLHVRVGETPGRTVIVSGPRFVIGRDATCQLNLASAQVSKQHAILEQRDEGLFLRDLASTNGTSINGHQLHRFEHEVRDGDEIRIGPVTLELSVGPSNQQAPGDCEQGAELRHEERRQLITGGAEPLSLDEHPTLHESEVERRIKVDVLEGVLVITPKFSELSDEGSLETLRIKLRTLFDDAAPRRVVVNLEFVNHLSRQAIALLLSHHLRLDWAGGALRLCHAHARIIALLDQVRLTMLVDCFPTLDEAVLAAWPCQPRASLVES